MKFKIVTDSTANLQTEYFKANDISVVTLYYLIKGEIFPAYKTDDPNLLKTFYQTVKSKPKLSTSCANEEQYYEEFEKAAKAGLPVVYIGFSSGVSASFSSAEAFCLMVSSMCEAARAFFSTVALLTDKMDDSPSAIRAL